MRYEFADAVGVCLGQAVPINETAKALLVATEDGQRHWIPKSAVHNDSEVYSLKSGPGKLIVFRWLAEKPEFAELAE